MRWLYLTSPPLVQYVGHAVYSRGVWLFVERLLFLSHSSIKQLCSWAVLNGFLSVTSRRSDDRLFPAAGPDWQLRIYGFWCPGQDFQTVPSWVKDSFLCSSLFDAPPLVLWAVAPVAYPSIHHCGLAGAMLSKFASYSWQNVIRGVSWFQPTCICRQLYAETVDTQSVKYCGACPMLMR